jgi:hypothetical protein
MLLKDKYEIRLRKRRDIMQPDIVFFPLDERNPAVIHEHKYLQPKMVNEERIRQKMEEATFQIYNMNYFKVLFDKDLKNIKWNTLIVRGVVGC